MAVRLLCALLWGVGILVVFTLVSAMPRWLQLVQTLGFFSWVYVQWARGRL